MTIQKWQAEIDTLQTTFHTQIYNLFRHPYKFASWRKSDFLGTVHNVAYSTITPDEMFKVLPLFMTRGYCQISIVNGKVEYSSQVKIIDGEFYEKSTSEQLLETITVLQHYFNFLKSQNDKKAAPALTSINKIINLMMKHPAFGSKPTLIQSIEPSPPVAPLTVSTPAPSPVQTESNTETFKPDKQPKLKLGLWEVELVELPAKTESNTEPQTSMSNKAKGLGRLRDRE